LAGFFITSEPLPHVNVPRPTRSGSGIFHKAACRGKHSGADEVYNVKANRPRAITTGRDSIPIVAVGASAGGLAALTALLKALPAHSGLAFVLISISTLSTPARSRSCWPRRPLCRSSRLPTESPFSPTTFM